MEAELTIQEAETLKELEHVINVQSTIDKAQAMDFIEQAKGLQLETKNEEEKEEILNDLKRSTLQKPQNESQIRPLTKLPPNKQAKAWMKAVRTAPDGKITAKHVQQVVNTMIGKATVKRKKEINDKIRTLYVTNNVTLIHLLWPNEAFNDGLFLDKVSFNG